jgi:hypothetical protein
MNNPDFELRDGKIFSIVSGDLIATIDTDGNLKMVQGKNALTPRVKAFLASPPSPPPDAPENTEASAAMEQMSENPDFSKVGEPDAEEVNTHILSESDEHIFFGDAPRHGTGLPATEKKSAADPDPEAISVYDIPESALPAFDPALGAASPELKSFIRKHKFNKVQTAELVRRLERMLAK